MHLRIRRAVWLLVVAASAASCSSDNLTLPSEGLPAALAVVSGGGQTAQVATALPDSLRVRVTDSESRPVEGVKVAFTALLGGGDAVPDTGVTNADGRTGTRWVLGTTAGAQRMQALVTGPTSSGALVQNFDATALAAAADTIFAARGNGQSAEIGAALPDSLVVRVTDQYGNSVSGTVVAWAPTGGGTVSPPSSTTGSAGTAATRRTLGPTAGPQGATATVAGLAGSPVSFTMTAQPAAPTSLIKVSGDNQTGAAGSAVAESLVVRLLDGSGNGVPGRNVTFAIATGGGIASPTSATTDANGRAATRWTLGAVAGANSLIATSSGFSATFQATGTSAGATTLLANSPVTQSDTAGLPVGAPPSVRVTDANGNSVAGVAVTFAVASGGGSIIPVTAITTNAAGVATLTSWTLGTAAGPNSVTATSGGLAGSPMTFSATGVAGAASQLQIQTQPSPSAQSGVAFTVQPAVRLADAFGNLVATSGTVVTAALASGTGTLGGTLTATTSNGVATFANLSITGVAGTYTLQFTSPGLAPVTSAGVTIGAGTATRLSMVTQPSATAQNAVPFAQQPAVQVQDAAGNPVGGVRAVTVSIASGGGTLGGTATVNTNASGLATFAGLAITGTVGARTLGFASAGLASATSSSISLTAGAPTQMAVNGGNGQSATVGTAVAVDPSVLVRDVSGNPVSGVAVTFAVTGGGGTVVPVTAVTTNASGIATTTSWTLGTTAGANTLTADAAPAGITGDPVTFTATGVPGAATQLIIQTQPSAAAQSGVAFAVQPAVRLGDAFGNLVATSGTVVTAALASGTGTLGGTLTATTSSGLATFANLSITGVSGAYTVRFTSGALTPDTSTTITIGAGTATRLAIVQQPSSTAQNAVAFATQPTVQLQDAAGNSVAQPGVVVTATIASGGGTLGGTLTATTSAGGLATFTNLSITGTVGARTLNFAGTGLTSAVSNSITITAGAPTQMAVNAGNGQSATAGSQVPIAPSVIVRDVSSNPVAGVAVTFAVTGGGGSVVPVTAVTTSAAGIAAVTSWTLGTLAGPNTLTADAAPAGITGDPVTFTATAVAGTAGRLAMFTQPSATAASGAVFATAPVVQLQDVNGNPVATSNVPITATVASGPGGTLAGALAVTDANGRAAFTSMSITGPVGVYTLQFNGTNLTGVTSSAITLAAGAPTQLAVVSQPTTAQSGIAFATAPTVQVQDAAGNPVSASRSISVVKNSGTAALSGPSPQPTNASGLATFPGLILTGATGPNSLLFSTAGLAADTTSTITLTAGTATQIAANSTTTQTDTAGLPVAVPPSVLVRDASNNPVAGVAVAFAVTGGGGSIVPLTPVLTNASGVATLTSWTLGAVAGTNTVTATVAALAGSPVTFTATGVAGAAAQIAANSATTQTDTAGLPVAVPPSVLVRDVGNNPVAGVAVTFAVTGGGGSRLPATPVVTNASGVATLTSWTLGAVAGTNTLTATVTGLTGSPVTFTATGVAGAATQITANSATTQSDTVGLPVAVPPSVLVRDASNNPVAGVAVTFAVTGGGGSIVPLTPVLTNASGLATLTSWTLGGTAGTNTVTATVAGLAGSPVTFTATGVAGAATQIAANSVTTQTDTAGLPVAAPPSVVVRDAGNNPVAGVAVTFAVTGGGGSRLPATPVATNASGVATLTSWTLGAAAGTNTLTATATGLAGSPVTFTATGVAGAATQIAANSVTTQSDTVGLPVAVPPSVVVRDAGNNPVAGVVVTFAVTGGGGAIVPVAPVLTDASGIATLTSWTLGAVAGTNTVTATVAGLTGSPVTFTATGLAGAATQIAANSVIAQTDTAGLPVASPPSVLVLDGSNNPVAGVAVTFAVTGGGGSIVPAAPVLTNASGLATLTSWTLGAVAGTNTVTATATGLTGSPVTFTATGVAGVATQIGLNAGNNQSATVGTAVGTPLSVVVRDAGSNPVAGVSVTFAVTSGGGSLGVPTVVATNASGIATAPTWTLGTTAGTNTVSATGAGTLTGNPVIFTATGLAGAATQMAANSVTTQSDTVGLPVAVPPSVLVRDASNNPVAGVAVAFAVTGGGGSIVPLTPVLTNASGVATLTSWTLGAVAGTNTVTATATGLTGSPVTFTATGVAGAATQIAANSVTTQTDTAALPVAVPPSVLVRDANSNPVAGVAVTFAVTAGGGSVLPATPVLTNASGVATLTSWTLGATAGTNTVTATVAALAGSPVTFTATGVAGAATQIAASSATTQSDTAGLPVAVPPSVLVRDAGNNPVAGVAVTFAVTGGGGAIVPVTPVLTDASGIATLTSWTLGGTAGTNTVTATATGLTGSPVTFTATGVAGAAAALVFSVQPSTRNANQAFTPPIRVQVVDGFGNLVGTATTPITLSIGNNPGGGTLSGTTTQNAANGVAAFNGLSIERSGTGYTLLANGGGLAQATSAAFDILPLAASQLAFLVQPSTGSVGSAITPAVQVEVRDAIGNRITTSTASITVAFGANPGGAALGGTLSRAAVGGVATFNDLSVSAAGAGYTLAASSGGLTGATSSAFTIGAAASATVIQSDLPDPSVVGQAVTVGYQVTSTGGNPTGNVTVSDGAGTSCVGTAAAGSCALTFLTAGARTLTATYAGDANFSGSASAGAAHTVSQAATTSVIATHTPDPSASGAAVSVTWTVTPTAPGAGTPTGNVTVSDGVNSCVAAVGAGGCSVALTTVGTRSLTATYTGDANFSGSVSGAVNHTVTLAATTTAITSDTPDPSVTGQLVTINYTVSAAIGTPTGNVTVSDGLGGSCVAAVATGTCSITFATAGARTLTATYAGDANFAGSASTGTPHLVNTAPTTTTITSDIPDPSVTGEAVPVNFTVTSAGGTPTGTVNVTDGVTACSATVAVGTCSLAFPTVGARAITATYVGDANFTGSASAGEPHLVNQATTTTTITTHTPDPSTTSTPVAVTWTVLANAPGAGTPTGTVTVTDGVDSCNATVAAGGCSLTLTTPGARSLVATYAGDTAFAGSASAAAAHQVN